jgi:uncharacterized protein YjiS (DUF1127 family)
MDTGQENAARRCEYRTHAKRVVLENCFMFIGILFGTIRRYFRYHENLLCIAQLDEHILHDIGLSRSELCAEAWDRAAGSTAH